MYYLNRPLAIKIKFSFLK